MPATRQEIEALQLAFERSHSRPARALADLLEVGSICLAKHKVREGPIGEAFELFVGQCLADQVVTIGQFTAAVKALGVLKATLAELDQLPE